MITSKNRFSKVRKGSVNQSKKSIATRKSKELGRLKFKSVLKNKKQNSSNVEEPTEIERPEAALKIEQETVLATSGLTKKNETPRTKGRKKNRFSITLIEREVTSSAKVEHCSEKTGERRETSSSKDPIDDVQHSQTKTASEAAIDEEHGKDDVFSRVEARTKRKLERRTEQNVVNNSVKHLEHTQGTSLTKSRVAPLKTSGFCWNADPKLLAEIIEPHPVCESSDDEDEDVSKKKKKRQTVAEKREVAKKEEERLRAVEESLASSSNLPSSCDEFDRALLSNPDSSELWLQYMAFHLQATEIEKARTVAQRALKTISYRKEQEKFNIWVGLLNLENLYGTQETLKKTLSEALQLNDAYKVRIQMINIYAENGKLQELESEVRLVAKKFRDVKDMWLEIGTILYKYGHIEHARRLLQQSLSSQRNKNETVALISRFAMMEAKFGEMERALALFDSVLVSHPQRVDVWSVCVDQLCKAGMIEQARSTLDRAIAQKLKTRWMKVLFAKYLTFEEKFGTPEGSERVREKAREYVEKVSASKLED